MPAIRPLVLLVPAAVCLALGLIAVYARGAILDEQAFGDRAVVALRSDEVRDEVATRLGDRLVDQSPALAQWRPVVADEAGDLTASPTFVAPFRAAARQLQRTLFDDGDAVASLDVESTGALLKARLAAREPRLARPLADVPAGDLMDLTGGGPESVLRRLAPAGRRLARLGPAALGLAAGLLAATMLLAPSPRRAAHAAALTVGVTGAALVAVWTVALTETLGQFDTSRGDAVVRSIWKAFLADLRWWSLALGAAGIVAAAAIGAALPGHEPARALTAARRRLASERWRGVLALGLLVAAGLLVELPYVAFELVAVALAGALLYRGVHELAALGLAAPRPGAAARARRLQS